jgi:hypothetical protein
MKTKGILTAVLLLFVAFSLVELVLKRVRASSAEAAGEQAAAAANTLTPGDKHPSPVAADRVIVYYCHSKERCENCRNYEPYTKELIQDKFGKLLQEGRLEWRVVNIDQPQGKHFDTDYQLGGIPTLVLVKVQGNKEVKWTKLEDGLMLVAMGDKAAFVQYAENGLRAFLEEKR